MVVFQSFVSITEQHYPAACVQQVGSYQHGHTVAWQPCWNWQHHKSMYSNFFNW